MKNRMKELRARYNLNQEELGNKIGVTRQTVSAIEKGKYGPSLELAFKMSKIFKCKIEEVFIYEE